MDKLTKIQKEYKIILNRLMPIKEKIDYQGLTKKERKEISVKIQNIYDDLAEYLPFIRDD